MLFLRLVKKIFIVQLIMNSSDENIHILIEIINLLKDVNCLRSFFNKNKIEYCNRFLNREIDDLIKRTHLHH